MNAQNLKSKSKFLSLVLRHEPEVAGITLDDAGWVAVDALLAGCGRAGNAITHGELLEIIRTNDKQRFALSEDGTRIRANQGHSVEIELGYAPAEPPGCCITAPPPARCRRSASSAWNGGRGITSISPNAPTPPRPSAAGTASPSC